MKVLVTGGAGYIGTHTIVELLNAGEEVVAFDNFYNSKPKALERVREITGKDFKFYEADMLDPQAMDRIFAAEKIDAVIHFAGLKAVGESCQKPWLYYHNNIVGTLNILDSMKKYGVKQFVFSSSATVYGDSKVVPVKEDFPTSATNPYGQTKLMQEVMLTDIAKAEPDMTVTLLRYFNPVGAHESGLIGEDPQDIPNNLTPYISQVAIGKLKQLSVFGDDYHTHDGTGVRDYIHVVDLARGHLKALQAQSGKTGVFIYNLGTGEGYSVLDVVHAFEKASGVKINYKIAPRRPGDVEALYADTEKAKRELGFVAEKNLDDMCRDLWNWQRKNPNGFES
ncbi:MAG: UDP-glucose 4-epimerase GalE [Clostridiales bacterium]|nr:MAG: UDP-glucose 4-epimerase GalE [Clostridiales bacterium]